ncbi:hypothetical protein [Streptomyces griseoluteus]
MTPRCCPSNRPWLTADGQVLRDELGVVAAEEPVKEIGEGCLATVIAAHDERGPVVDLHFYVLQRVEARHFATGQLY